MEEGVNKIFYLKLTVLVIVLSMQFVGIFDHSLWTPDEPRVAEIAREMAVSGDYLIPQHSNAPFLEQPPLYYTLAALFYRIFGTSNEGFGRLASVIFALATLAVVFYGTRRLFSERIALLAVLILSSCFTFYEVSHKMLVDSALCLFITGALFSFILAETGRFKHGYKLFWIGLGLAFMSKGIIGIAIPCVAATAYYIWQGKFPELKKIWFFQGCAAVIIFMAAWAFVLYQRGGIEFIRTFYLYNQLGRFLNIGIYSGGHVRPFYYYFTTIWADAAPWSLILVPFFISIRNYTNEKKFIVSWFIAGFILLSIASTKRGLYILPLLPAMAVMAALWMEHVITEASSRTDKVFFWIIIILVSVCSLLLPFVYVMKFHGAYLTAVLLLLTGLALPVFVYRIFKPGLAFVLVVSWTFLIVLWIPFVIPLVDIQKSYKPLFTQIGEYANGSQVTGYQLTESLEAFSPFYGNFYVENIENRDVFEKLIKSPGTSYLMIIPVRTDDGLKQLIKERYTRIVSDTDKDVEIWKRWVEG
ncbi:MAG TPA: glycosyltransferase family 39 protein [Desulfomonilia bacterium]